MGWVSILCYLGSMAVRTDGSSGNRNGGRTLASSGYWLVKRRGHPMADSRGYVYEHRLVASEQLGRPLLPGEVAHHRNGDKLDNRPENIAVLPSASAHAREHHFNPMRRQRGEPNPTVECGCGCGQTFPRFDVYNRPRRFRSGHNPAGWFVTGGAG